MKILAISHLFPHVKERHYGIFVARQLLEMYRQGAKITVIVPRVICPRILRYFKRYKDKDHTSSLCQFQGLETLSIPYIRPPGNWYNRWSGLVVFHTIKKKALQLHRQKKFDVIYATGFFPDGDAAVRLAKNLNIPVACLGIGTDVNETSKTNVTIYRHFIRTVQQLDGTLACGRSVADGIDAVTGKQSLCVYGVLDLEEFSPASDKSSFRKELGLPLDKTIALYAGYLTRKKGVCELVETFHDIQEEYPDILLIICGNGPEESRLKEIVREKNIQHVIRIIGEVEPEQMSKWFKASDLFVLASYSEGMPNVVMEAMACGLPVVATSVGGLVDAMGDCEGAILIPPRNVEALKDSILKIITDEQLRSRMKIAARAKAEESFGVKRNAQRIIDYLASLLEKKRQLDS